MLNRHSFTEKTFLNVRAQHTQIIDTFIDNYID